MDYLQTIHTATEALLARLDGRRPVVGIVLGSGLGPLADAIQAPVIVPYASLPFFPQSTAIGHAGNYICGFLGGKVVLAMQGRIHSYEGYDLRSVTLPIQVMVEAGIRYLFVSNAAGGTHPAYRVGDLMIISDHINRIPNPLIGPNLDERGPRFPDMTRPYDPGLIRRAKEIAALLDIPVHKGTYLAVSGPCYETPAEYRFFREIGADAVGMSTTPEVIVARHAGVPVFGMSVITDVAHDTDDDDYVTDGEAIIAAASGAAKRMCTLFESLIGQL